MNKTFTTLLALASVHGAIAQIYFEDDFEGGTLTANHAWTNQVVVDADVIGEVWEYGTVGGNYARCSNFVSSANHTLNVWLISPAINLSAATNPTFNFDMTKRYAGDDIIVHISTDYSGSGLPSTATWTDITSLITLDSDIASWAFVNSGDGDLTPYIASSVYIAFEYIGSNSDGSTWEVDNIVVQEGGTVVSEVPIYDIQYTTASPANSPYEGDVVTTRGIVTAKIVNGPDAGAYFLQDGTGGWNGIYVFDTDAVVAIGDSVVVTGEVDEFNLLTEIKNVSAYTVLTSSNTLPASVQLTSSAATQEQYEGVLITATSAECTANSEGFGLWAINDGSGVVKCDDDIFPYHLIAIVGNWYMVTGVGHYSFSEAKILPRSLSDITITGTAGIEENNTFTIYPNPANSVVMLNVQADAVVRIYSTTGTLVYEGIGETTIDVSNFAAGIYQVTVLQNETTSTQKLSVQ